MGSVASISSAVRVPIVTLESIRKDAERFSQLHSWYM
jgi:hypothetical protein